MARLFCIVTLLCCVSQTVFGCSCTVESLSRSRADTIRNDFAFSSTVYAARVVGASCNCITDATLSCVNYTQLSTGAVSAQVVAKGVCEGGRFRSIYIDMCANLNTVLSVDTNIEPGMGLPTVNLTQSGFCSNVCPFNMRENDFEASIHFCQYTVELVEVFKPQNFTGSSTMTVFGPDTLTSCGDPNRRLSINETYLIGVGGPCTPFAEWPTLESFSTDEIRLLRELRGDSTEPTDVTTPVGSGGVATSVYSLLSITLSMLILLAA